MREGIPRNESRKGTVAATRQWSNGCKIDIRPEGTLQELIGLSLLIRNNSMHQNFS
jgi:hypothetical protein